MKDCILITIPHHKMKALLHEFSRSLGRPIVSILLWDRIQDKLDMDLQEFRAIGPVYSVPDHFREVAPQLKALGTDELDALQRSLEVALAIRNNGMVLSSDRNFRNIKDFRTARELQIACMMLAKRIFDEHSFAHIMTGREDYLRNLIADHALHLGVPAHEFVHTRHCGMRLVALDHRGQYVGMQEAFDKLRSVGDSGFDPGLLSSADAQFEAFLNRPSMPRFAIDGARSLLRSISGVLLSGARSVADNIRMYRSYEYDRVSGELTAPWRVVARWPAKALRMFIMDHTDFLCGKITAGEKYLYLPLHMSPESVDMYYGRDYSLHEAFVTELSRRIPSDYCIYVKENSAMVGQRSLGFYKRLKSLYNVKVIHHNVDTFALIDGCAAVLSVTGTAGWEAYLMNKPVIVLGDVFYNFLPGVLHSNMYAADFSSQVSQYIEQFRPDMDERRQALRACYICSEELGFEVGMGDMKNEAAAAPQLAQAVRTLADFARAHARD